MGLYVRDLSALWIRKILRTKMDRAKSEIGPIVRHVLEQAEAQTSTWKRMQVVLLEHADAVDKQLFGTSGLSPRQRRTSSTRKSWYGI